MSIDSGAAEVLSFRGDEGSRWSAAPAAPPPGAEDSSEATSPGIVRASPQSPRALALLDDEVTVARESDAHAHRHERAQRPRLPPVFDADPATLPVSARAAHDALSDDVTLQERDDFSGDGVTSLAVEAPPASIVVIVPVAPAVPVAPSSLDDSTADLRPRDPMPIHRVPALRDDAPPSPRPRPRTLAPPAAPASPAGPSPAPPPRASAARPDARLPDPPAARPPPPPAAAPDLFPEPPAAGAATSSRSPPAPAEPRLEPGALPPPRTAMAVAPEVDDESVDHAHFKTPLPLPCTLRAALSWRKSNPGNPRVEEVAIAFTKCLCALHERSIVLGERIVPENFTCLADGAVEYMEALDPPQRPAVEQYLAPELFRGREATAQTDVFGAAAVVYELLVGRALKPAFLPQVAQTTRTDTWFSDPGASLPEPYRQLLRPALSDRAAQRHPDMATFSEELFRAWRLVHNPERRVAVKEAPKPFFTRAVKIAIGVAVFVLFLTVLAFFPIDQLTAPPVPTVQPSLGQ